ncbi:MAG: YggS family pyridoxal phosphate-dependent enzyme [Candidatus Omnitrophica bacterium]|nr:YggS family pyridoxal phosphate-dependent enzyme [Candidatus Omnitrophota bacterium]
MSITKNFQHIRNQLPPDVTIVVAAKQRIPEEVKEVIEAGATDIGQNYVQEGVEMHQALADLAHKVRWHMIGDLQKNKINKALSFCDIIQTIDSKQKAEAIDKRVKQSDRKQVSCLIEVNIGCEFSKSGIPPEPELAEQLAQCISLCPHLRLEGVMTMGPVTVAPEDIRPFFRQAHDIYKRLQDLNLKNTNIQILSMGMTHSYNVAVSEGSNMVRIGTALFGTR